LLPAGLSPAVPAREIMARGAYSLWQYSDAGYAELVQVTGRLTANRFDIGPRSQLLLDTLGAGQDWSVAWPGLPGPRSPKEPSISPGTALPSPGIVASVRPDLGRGEISADVTMTEPGALLFSVAYDPGWHAWVDGQPARTEMLAPALVGVQLTPGRHDVVLRYIGFGWYPELWVAGLLSLAVLWAGGRWWYKEDAACHTRPHKDHKEGCPS
jgi:Bacterial membrane protein YfhO